MPSCGFLYRALRKFDIRMSHIHPEDQLAVEEMMLMRAERLERSKILGGLMIDIAKGNEFDCGLGFRVFRRPRLVDPLAPPSLEGRTLLDSHRHRRTQIGLVCPTADHDVLRLILVEKEIFLSFYIHTQTYMRNAQLSS